MRVATHGTKDLYSVFLLQGRMIMTHRERIWAAIRGAVPDRLPWVPRLEFWHRARLRQGTLAAWPFTFAYPDRDYRPAGWGAMPRYPISPTRRTMPPWSTGGLVSFISRFFPIV